MRSVIDLIDGLFFDDYGVHLNRRELEEAYSRDLLANGNRPITDSECWLLVTDTSVEAEEIEKLYPNVVKVLEGDE